MCKQLVINLADVSDVTKRNRLVPGIEVITKSQQHFLFVSFEARTRAFLSIKRQLNQVKQDKLSAPRLTKSLPEPLSPTAPSTTAATTTTANDDEPMLFDGHLANTIIHEADVSFAETVHAQFAGVTPLQLFRQCFSDQSGAFAARLHEAAKDRRLETTKWQADTTHGMLRTVTFEAQLSGLPLGPPSTRVRETQWYTLSRTELVVDTVQESLDIPYADAFTVESRWVAKSAAAGGSTELVVKSGVYWKKRIILRKQVESVTNQKTRKAHQAWLALAQEVLVRQVQKQQKQQLPQQQQQAEQQTSHQGAPPEKSEEGAEAEQNRPAKPAAKRAHSHYDTSSAKKRASLTDVLLFLALVCLLVVIAQNIVLVARLAGPFTTMHTTREGAALHPANYQP